MILVKLLTSALSLSHSVYQVVVTWHGDAISLN